MGTIGVFFGGKSPEHDISIITGQLILSGLKGLGHEVVPVYLDKQGRWFIGEALGSIEFFQHPRKNARIQKLGQYVLDLEASCGKVVFRKKGLRGGRVVVDTVFPAFHGQNGEDGTVQGLFELFNVPYVGCGVTASAITMDKVLTKRYYEHHGILTTKFIAFSSRKWVARRKELLNEIGEKLRWPLFVKPARLGSSIAVEKVKDERELTQAIDVALHYDDKALVEEGIEDLIDVTCAVLGNEDPQPSLLQESLFGDELFSYEEKYLKGGGAQLGKAQKNIVIPARLDEQITEQTRAQATTIFKLFECSGIARVDFLYDKKTKQMYANEVNTLPGTLYHHLWKESGVSLPELLTKLLELAQERYAAKQKLISSFASDVLSQSGSAKLQSKLQPTDEE